MKEVHKGAGGARDHRAPRGSRQRLGCLAADARSGGLARRPGITKMPPAGARRGIVNKRDPVQPPPRGTLRHKTRLRGGVRSEEHTSELQSLMRTSYAVFCFKKKITHPPILFYPSSRYY